MQRILELSASEIARDPFGSRKKMLESFMSWKDQLPKYVGRHIGYNPDKTNIVTVLGRPEISKSGRLDLIKSWRYGMNLVTDDGDIYYAQKATGETPAMNEDFGAGRMELQNPAMADTPAKDDTYTDVNMPITASRKVFDMGYPVRDDMDTDNTGAGVDVATYRTSWTTADFNATGIVGGCIHDNASPMAATPRCASLQCWR